MTSLRNINRRVIGRIDLKGRILEVLTFKLVTAGDEVDVTHACIETQIQRMNQAIGVRSRTSADWLKSNSQRAAKATSVRRQTLIANAISESLGWTLRKVERT